MAVMVFLFTCHPFHDFSGDFLSCIFLDEVACALDDERLIGLLEDMLQEIQAGFGYVVLVPPAEQHGNVQIPQFFYGLQVIKGSRVIGTYRHQARENEVSPAILFGRNGAP